MSTRPMKFVCEIRPAQPEDSAQIAKLATQLGYPSNPNETARRLEEIQRSSESCIFVARLAGAEIAGRVWALLGAHANNGSACSCFVQLRTNLAWR